MFCIKINFYDVYNMKKEDYENLINLRNEYKLKIKEINKK
ncbi:hypothetical protein BMW23_1212 [Bodo saltans virus]|uniref:Uncharacterized protein n=1 Tax=Bodo saltans virus TaxID=2024608 RepID=A0A2H4UWJ6_9VIRU|nr:hypothetical protein QJ851_gp1192 [Bodo saltans virus]ATZ81255.1 hypothetical protein BMW23_1212 [Bodo saltans virus]